MGFRAVHWCRRQKMIGSTSDVHSRLALTNERRAGFGQDQSIVLVLSTDEDTHDDALRCGEALSAVLLECTLAGKATCTLTQLTELWSSRNLIGTLTGRAAMQQVLIRVGEALALGEVPPMTPRRPLREVLAFHDA